MSGVKHYLQLFRQVRSLWPSQYIVHTDDRVLNDCAACLVFSGSQYTIDFRAWISVAQRDLRQLLAVTPD